MKILFYSETFWPNIGGVEDIGHGIVTGLCRLGHVVTVVTPTPSATERPVAYKVIRHPSLRQFVSLVRSHDIVHANGIAMKPLPLALLFGKPFSWTHHGYQLQAIDGAGWVNGKPAPLEPWASFYHHRQIFGFPVAFIGWLKVLGRRFASRLISANVPTSQHLTVRQPTPREVVIYNPYDVDVYGAATEGEAKQQLEQASVTFTYIGRLVSEKGVADLLYAFADVLATQETETGKRTLTLKVIGDGPDRQRLESLAVELNITDNVVFTGSKTGAFLKQELATAGICVIPSAWEEPGALIALNLMGAGKPLIVSQRGWLSESAGDACLTFANGDRLALAACMDKLYRDRQLQITLIDRGFKRMEIYTPQACAQGYADLFAKLLNRSKEL